MPANYGLAVAFVTVVALALYDLAASGAGIAVTSGARLLDTLIGAVLAVILRLALWPRANATRMPYLQAKTLQAVAATFRSRWLSDGHGLRPAQRCLQTELLNLRAVYRDTVADQVTAATGGAGYVTPVVDELAVLALGIPFERPDPARPAAEALIRRLDQLTDALAARKAPQEGGEPVSLPGYPRTEAAVNLLTALQLRILGRP